MRKVHKIRRHRKGKKSLFGKGDVLKRVPKGYKHRKDHVAF